MVLRAHFCSDSPGSGQHKGCRHVLMQYSPHLRISAISLWHSAAHLCFTWPSLEEGQPRALWGAFGIAGLILFSDRSLGPSGWTGCQHSWVGDVGCALLSASLRQESEDRGNFWSLEKALLGPVESCGFLSVREVGRNTAEVATGR